MPLDQVVHTYRRGVEARPKEPDTAGLRMRARETFHALDQDVCAVINRKYGLAVLVLERILRVS